MRAGTFHPEPLPVGWGDRPKDEPHVPLRADALQILASKGWRRFYALGPVLGDGVSAKVYQAESYSSSQHGLGASGDGLGKVLSCGAAPPCIDEHGRRVAIKRFHRAGSKMFKKEVDAFMHVGIHPNVLRLLETYERCEGEDVLVLEYCDGATLYDLYARQYSRGGLPEQMIANIVLQILMALEHLHSCGVEHQDVKPENMMLNGVAVSKGRAHLKLGDFGWASLPPRRSQSGSPSPRVLPANGIGSLWYAPPEQNPPVPGIGGVKLPEPLSPEAEVLRGRNDMWSVGVVAYLLSVGQNPFSAALRKRVPADVDAEVLRLVAVGSYNNKDQKFLRLNKDFRELITALLQVNPSARPPAAEALRSMYFTKRWSGDDESVLFPLPAPCAARAERRNVRWAQLDGVQRLAWLAVARAIAEPEIDRHAIGAVLAALWHGPDQATLGGQGNVGKKFAYLFALAHELGTGPMREWHRDRDGWGEVVRLAFSYLDVDSDGLLTAHDLASHIALQPAGTGEAPTGAAVATIDSDALAVARTWVARWQVYDTPPRASAAKKSAGLKIGCFRAMLVARPQHDEDSESEGPGGPFSGPVGIFAHEAHYDEEEFNWTDLVPRFAAHVHGKRLL